MPPKRSAKTSDNEEIVYAPAQLQPITETIEKNYMPYVMSVIVSRAIPEIDGLKPSHRKLLYTMYKMGLLTGNRTKSANIVGQTMKLNPHGDASIYETMVRLTRGNEALLHPLIDSKGSFGKQYSSVNMKYAASRYTEAKLDPICAELFAGIDKDAVDMVDNYDGTMKEPSLLPTTFPHVLIMPNMGIAVGMASNICSFNLAEICDGTIAILRNPNIKTDKLMEIIKAPDFPGGGTLLYDKEQMREVFETGQGSVRLRARYRYDKANNCIDILQIPYFTTIEQIQKSLTDMVKDGSLKEITDFRDEIDLSGFKLTLDLRRDTDPEKLMAKLFKKTPLEDSFKCNFNILIDSVPRTMGVKEILNEWIRFRMGCVRRELTFDLQKKKDKLHLLLGLGKILLDIDKAINIIRKTEQEADVVPNLEKGFGIDQIQAEYIAEIKLRHLNREYILNRIKEIEGLQKEIAEIEDILGDELKIKAYIAKQLSDIKRKYGMPRKTQFMSAEDVPVYEEEEGPNDFGVQVVLTKEGYIKKLLSQNLKGNEDHKMKEGDEIAFQIDTDNLAELVFFTDQGQLYRCKASDLDITKPNAMGDYLPAKLGMDEDEKPIYMRVHTGYPAKDRMIFLFANGKGVRIPVKAYETKAVRRKLTGAFSTASPVVGIFYENGKAINLLMVSDAGKAICVKSTLIPEMATRNSNGSAVFDLKKGEKLTRVTVASAAEAKVFKKLQIPAAGIPITKMSLK